MSTHEMVRAYIDEHGLCRKYIAANMGISDSKLSQLLNGKRRMTVDDYMTLCQAIAVDPRTFFVPTSASALQKSLE